MDHHPMWDLCLSDRINETRMLSKMSMASKLVLLMSTDAPSRALFGIRFDVKEMDAFRLKASEDVASESSLTAGMLTSAPICRFMTSSLSCVYSTYFLTTLITIVEFRPKAFNNQFYGMLIKPST